MKKFLLILGMVTCLLGATACGEAETVAEASITMDDAMQIATAYVELINDFAVNNVNIEENADAIEQYYGISAKAAADAVENFGIALEDLGQYEGIESVSFTEEDKELTINATILGSNVNPKGEKRSAEVIITLILPKGTFDSMLTNVNYTFTEMMTNAALNTILGIGTVFAVLVILMVIISCFKFVNIAEQNAAKKKAEKASAAKANAESVDNAVAQIAANEEAQDDTELIAVIAAAIAASEGASSSDGYVVRSIRRRY